MKTGPYEDGFFIQGSECFELAEHLDVVRSFLLSLPQELLVGSGVGLALSTTRLSEFRYNLVDKVMGEAVIREEQNANHRDDGAVLGKG